jgi:antitoxin component of MazEF toxin-antitoxin module
MAGSRLGWSAIMTRITVGTWGKDIASGVLQDVAREAGFVDGQQVEIEVKDGDIVIHRPAAVSPEAKARALAALERIIENSKGVTLGDVTIRELIDEGRRG